MTLTTIVLILVESLPLPPSLAAYIHGAHARWRRRISRFKGNRQFPREVKGREGKGREGGNVLLNCGLCPIISGPPVGKNLAGSPGRTDRVIAVTYKALPVSWPAQIKSLTTGRKLGYKSFTKCELP
ncbi:hypothetical protein B9Z19DRAFT_1094381 [Tuber borchii]|uniref:Secreted protein n=1 Tax=Tuber borchii TaxID=42251 RepID=A0A2T6ZE84_TUBBO|nr:hypothetical protein B9Z19DRAFT_1094381 [Tuber borchii]